MAKTFSGGGPSEGGKTMPLPVLVRPAEIEELRAIAAKKGMSLAEFVRDRLGLSPVRRGRPPSRPDSDS